MLAAPVQSTKPGSLKVPSMSCTSVPAAWSSERIGMRLASWKSLRMSALRIDVGRAAAVDEARIAEGAVDVVHLGARGLVERADRHAPRELEIAADVGHAGRGRDGALRRGGMAGVARLLERR